MTRFFLVLIFLTLSSLERANCQNSLDTVETTLAMEEYSNSKEAAELSSKMKELELRQKEFELKQSWARRIVPIMVTSLLSLLIAFFTAKWKIKSELEKVRYEFKQSSLKEIISEEEISNARKKIKFLLDAGLIDDDDSKINQALSEFTFATEATDHLISGTRLFDELLSSIHGQNKLSKEELLSKLNKLIILFTSTIDLEPGNHLAFRSRALAYQKLAHNLGGDEATYYFERSIEDLSNAIELRSDFPHYYYLRSIGYSNIKMADEALKDIRKANELSNNKNPVYIFYEGIWLIKKEEYQESFKKINQAITIIKEAVDPAIYKSDLSIIIHELKVISNELYFDRKSENCEYLKIAIKLGDEEAKEIYNKRCR